jgi:uncharacterized hydantoinase/oxoprolinase family protein
MSANLTTEYAELLQNYRNLVQGVGMIRRAVERAFRAGVLPSVDRSGSTPLQECEAIARAIYAAAVQHKDQSTGGRLAGLDPDDPAN